MHLGVFNERALNVPHSLCLEHNADSILPIWSPSGRRCRSGPPTGHGRRC